jgi:hypothetical protein
MPPSSVLRTEKAVGPLILVYFMQVPLKATVLCIEEAVGFVEGPYNLKNFAAMKVQEIVFLEFSLLPKSVLEISYRALKLVQNVNKD